LLQISVRLEEIVNIYVKQEVQVQTNVQLTKLIEINVVPAD